MAPRKRTKKILEDDPEDSNFTASSSAVKKRDGKYHVKNVSPIQTQPEAAAGDLNQFLENQELRDAFPDLEKKSK